ncbi:SAC3 domain-containing protein 1 [Sabethes cyaneus]|uniref:SAC3 domain-containing protein 1 n=1 Tax=Sabethes cyaneus TaxID=53552 RepID=UPI00237E85AE|nr:SAC3 domain-containing protein 1 [Sabethes cyaneus]
MEQFICGKCESMCPKSEIELRTREKLLHFYELRSSGARQPSEPSRVVKEFSRSAAGVKRPKETDIRSVQALKRTVKYLLTEVFHDDRRSYNFKYDFIFDRLRAVRQEMVMQNLSAEKTLQLLEPIIRFLAYSAYRLCEAPISEFDPKICNTHLQECLKKALRCYDELNKQSPNRTEMEGLYLMFNLGHTEALNRGISLPSKLKESLRTLLRMNIEYHRGNFYRVLHAIQKLPPLEAALAVLKLAEIRRQMLLRFSVAFQSKVLIVPLEWLHHVLHYQKCEGLALIDDCKYYNLQVIDQSARSTKTKTDWWEDDEDSPSEPKADAAGGQRQLSHLNQKSVKFEKAQFDANKPANQPRRMEFVDRALGSVKAISALMIGGDADTC